MYHLQIAILMSDAQEVFFQNLTARHCHAKFAHRSHPCIPFIPTGLYGPQQDVRSLHTHGVQPTNLKLIQIYDMLTTYPS
jgi:hypothetical protein